MKKREIVRKQLDDKLISFQQAGEVIGIDEGAGRGVGEMHLGHQPDAVVARGHHQQAVQSLKRRGSFGA